MGKGRELELNRETVQFLIDKAHEFHVKEAVTIPEEPLSPSDDWAHRPRGQSRPQIEHVRHLRQADGFLKDRA